jgi:hypothetical protein
MRTARQLGHSSSIIRRHKDGGGAWGSVLSWVVRFGVVRFGVVLSGLVLSGMALFCAGRSGAMQAV